MIVRTKEQWLKFYHKKYGNFYVSEKIGKKWVLYPEDWKDHKWYQPNHRIIFPDEIVIDVDSKTEAEHYRKEIVKILKKNELNFNCWYSGGKGSHTHVVFPELLKLIETDRRLMKELLVEHYFGNIIQDAKIDLQLTGKHLIRLEEGRHEQTQGDKQLSVKHREKRWNRIPKEVKDRFVEEKMKVKVYKPTKHKRGNSKLLDFIETNDFAAMQDGRKNAAFILFQMTRDEERVRRWNDYCLGRYLSEFKLRGIFNNKTKYTLGNRFLSNWLKEFGHPELILELLE